jgi:protein-export membrane protein, secD/secF family
MNNKKGKGLLSLFIILVALAGFTYLAYVSLKQIKLGLDLAGGVSITYQTKIDNPSDEDMADTVYKLQQRVEGYSTEAEVYREGNNRINIDIPGVSDANAILEELGKPGSLVFMDTNNNILLTGDLVESAKAVMYEKNGQKEYAVSLTFAPEGKAKFAEATTQNVGKQIAIVYDQKVVSSPVVREAITGGECQIDGMKTIDEAEHLASTIRIGSLSLELEELRSNVVGAKLGQEAISTSLKAGAIGFGILALFMVVIYLLPGFASVLALILYIDLTVCLVAAFEITLTLPGIAGVILAVGMAVDANVIIFTRIKEEIGAGKSVKSSISNGFHKALSAIIDGNVTTLIAAAVLYLKGSGTVKGFATTLAIGILLSMFTALFVTRFILNAFVNLGIENEKLYGTVGERKTIDFLKYRSICFIVSVAMIISGFVFMGVNRSKIGSIMNYGIDFKGGTSTNVTFNEDMSLEDISSKVVPVVEGVTKEAGTQTQKVKDSNEVIIKTRALTVEEREALNKALAETFNVDAEKITAESISAAVSDEMRNDALWATAIAGVLMLIYIWIRFSDFNFAASSVLALVHDVLVLVACYAVFRWSVGSTFIACVLTLIGYSINATIVIFDRIRENSKALSSRTSREDLINISISQTLTRSINTSLTTFIMITVLYVMGVSSIKEFALPIMVGIVVGTYSSICLAGAMWYTLSNLKKKRVE